jgi:hypothetical protein
MLAEIYAIGATIATIVAAATSGADAGAIDGGAGG